MTERHVHWADDVVGNEEDDDDDSLADSPSPQTPLTTLEPVMSTAVSRHGAGGVTLRIQPPAFPLTDVRVRSPDRSSGRHGQSSPSLNLFNMTTMDESIPRLGPSASSSGPELHPLLASGVHTLIWNVGDRPSSATVFTISPRDRRSLSPVSHNIPNEPATSPPQQEMHIHCISHQLWRPLVLRAAELRSPQAGDNQRSAQGLPSADYVAVKHVIGGIFNYLHTAMTSREYDALDDNKPMPGLKAAVTRSFYQRCDAERGRAPAQQSASTAPNVDNPYSPLRERSDATLGARTVGTNGLRRLDCLLGQTRFLGLEKVPGISNEWYMIVEAPV